MECDPPKECGKEIPLGEDNKHVQCWLCLRLVVFGQQVNIRGLKVYAGPTAHIGSYPAAQIITPVYTPCSRPFTGSPLTVRSVKANNQSNRQVFSPRRHVHEGPVHM